MKSTLYKNEPTSERLDLVDVQPFGESPETGNQTILVRTENIEVVRVAIRAGQHIPTYEAQGELVLHCLEGHARVEASDEMRQIQPGQLLRISVGEPFAITALASSLLLITIALPKQGESIPLIGW